MSFVSSFQTDRLVAVIAEQIDDEKMRHGSSRWNMGWQFAAWPKKTKNFRTCFRMSNKKAQVNAADAAEAKSMSYQMAKFARQSRISHPATMTALALPKLRVPFQGRILANSDELISGSMVNRRACAASIHALLALAKLKSTRRLGIGKFPKSSKVRC